MILLDATISMDGLRWCMMKIRMSDCYALFLLTKLRLGTSAFNTNISSHGTINHFRIWHII